VELPLHPYRGERNLVLKVLTVFYALNLDAGIQSGFA